MRAHAACPAAPPAPASPTAQLPWPFGAQRSRLSPASARPHRHPRLRRFSVASAQARPRPAPPDLAWVSCCHRAPGHPGSAPRAFAFLTARGHPLTRRRFGYLFPYPLPSSNPRPARAGAAAVWLADQQEPRSGRRATDPRRSNGVTGSHTWPRSLRRLRRPGRSAYGAGRMSPSGRNGFANSVAQSAFRPRLQRIDLIF